MTNVPTAVELSGHSRDAHALRGVRRVALAGVSMIALGLGMAAALPVGKAQAQDTRTVVNGNGGGGIIVLNVPAASDLLLTDANDGILGSGGFNADAADMTQITPSGVVQGAMGNYTISDKIFTNFTTKGGAGSGGGGGLGGVVFIDKSTTVTMNNVDFTRNTVIGGTGGSSPAVNAGAVAVSLGDINLPFYPITAYYFDPSLTPSGGSYSTNSITLTEANRGLRPGMRIALPGSSTLVTIDTISADRKTLTFTPTTLPGSSVIPELGLDRTTGQSGNQLSYTFVNNVGSLKVGQILMLDGVKSGVKVESVSGNTVTLTGNLSSSQWAAITDPVPANRAVVQFVDFLKADISQVKGITADSITLPGQNGFFKNGMVLTGGEFGSGTVTVTDVQYVDIGGGNFETKVTVSGGAPPANLSRFTATYEQATIGSDELKLSNSRLFAGMKVTGEGLTGDVFVGSVNNGIVKLVDGNGDPVIVTVKPETLSFSGVTGTSGSTVTFVNATMLDGVSEGMLVSGPGIPPGTTVASISGNQVTLNVPGSGTLSSVSEITFASATAEGGSMNDLDASVTGTTGRDGNSAPASNVVWGDGEGKDGKNADKGTFGTVGIGGTGGKGGNGSAGLQWSPEQVKAVVDAGIDAGFDTAEAAAALSSVPPDVAESVAAALQAAHAFVNLGFEIGKLSEWYVDYAAGDNAVGGEGGKGGAGGNGDYFFGGGVGGDGGKGADAGNTTVGDGGDGGDGGAGGNGGFGGGGGMGGAGGTHGLGVSVADGEGGAGGKAGFGGGIGSNGDGEDGGGGAGFGGAIFVRNTGALTITGNSTFNYNRAEGGSSTNGGRAGNAAGADLFMMKGSTVVLQAGTSVVSGKTVDNVITFNGTIGDDSRESYDEATNARGFGANLTVGKGLVVFNGKNTYTGQTIMAGGVLDADDGWGLNHYSNLNFNGAGRTGSLLDNTNAGVLLTSGYFGRQVGSIGTQTQWTGSGGFAAKGGDLIINLGNLPNPMKLTWGTTPGFFRDGANPVNDAALVFGSEHADSIVTWLNPIDLGALDRQILVTNNGNADATDDYVIMDGAISGTGGLIVGEASSTFWDGSLFLTGQNTFTGAIDIRSGLLSVSSGGSLASGVDVTIADGAAFQVQNSDVTLGQLTGGANSNVGISDGSLTITEASPGFLGTATVAADGTLILTGAGSIPNATVDLAGLFDISGITAAGTSVADLFGDGTIALGTKTLAVSDASNGTFSGTITGTGAFGVSGGQLNLDFTNSPTVNANIFGQTGGKVFLTGGTIDTSGSGKPALSVINGGTVDVKGTKLITGAGQPTASVYFDDTFNVANNPARVVLGAGTVIQNGGPLLVVTRDGVTPTGNAFDGNVQFIIDNGATVVGDILDETAVRTPGMGSTTAYLGAGVKWTGKAVAGDFLVNGGASAHFNSGSLLDNLYAGTGAQVDLSGNVVILGRFTIDANGVVAPGSSPGTYNPGTFESNNGNETLWIRFGQNNPLPGEGKDYSQINVAGDFTGLGGVGPGVLAITLERWNSTQSTPLGNIADIELLKIGGIENPGSNVYLAKRFTQNGHELLLDRRVRNVDPFAVVAGTEQIGSPTEDVYFDDSSLVVFGLRSIVQDETYGLAALTGTAHQAGLDTLGSFLERRGTGELESTWGRAGYSHTEVNDTIDNVQDVAFGQYGVDLVQMGDLRVGVLGSFSSSNSGIETETGTAGLLGTVWSGGAYATWDNGNAYLDAVGQYGFGTWSFSPTAATGLNITSHTGLASAEAGFRIGDDQASITPWTQVVLQTTYYSGLDSEWVGAADFTDNNSLFVRGGVRAEGKFGGLSPFVDLNVTYNVYDVKTVTVDGFDQSTGMGGTRVELGAGFQAELSESAKVWGQVKGVYGDGEDTGVVGYQGQAGMRVSW